MSDPAQHDAEGHRRRGELGVMAAMRGMAASALAPKERPEDDDDLLEWLKAGLLALPRVVGVRRIRVNQEGEVSEPEGEATEGALLSDLDRCAFHHAGTATGPVEQRAADGRLVNVAVPVASRGDRLDILLAEADADGPGISELERVAAATLGDQVAMAVAVRRARADARLDDLTGCLDHGAMHEQLAEEIARAQRLSGRLACVMLDLDDFKSVNERHGHPVGDRLLRLVSAAMRLECRPYDVCCRYGGDEFLVILPDAGIEEAAHTAERLRAAAAAAVLLHEKMEISVSATAGVADWRPGESPAELLVRVDRALMRGKGTGKDSVARD